MSEVSEGDALKKLLQEKWQQEEAPLFDGIIYDDCSMVVFEYERMDRNGERGHSVRVTGQTTLADFLAQDPEMWTGLLEMGSATWDAGGLVIHCGGGGFGSDGFVSATRASDGQLMWLAFSQRTNPFRRLEFQNEQLLAYTEPGQVWRFPLPRPDSVEAGWPDAE